MPHRRLLPRQKQKPHELILLPPHAWLARARPADDSLIFRSRLAAIFDIAQAAVYHRHARY